jgi:hypothetical protein
MMTSTTDNKMASTDELNLEAIKNQILCKDNILNKYNAD